MKKYFFGLLAVVLAVGFSAFSTNHGKNARAIYYWRVANTIASDAYSSASLDFPTSAPQQTTFTCAAGDVHLCSLGFSNYVLNGGVYKPSINGTTVIAPADYETNLQDQQVKDIQ